MTRPMPESWRRADHASYSAPDPLTATASWSEVIELRPDAWRARALAAMWSPDDPVA